MSELTVLLLAWLFDSYHSWSEAGTDWPALTVGLSVCCLTCDCTVILLGSTVVRWAGPLNCDTNYVSAVVCQEKNTFPLDWTSAIAAGISSSLWHDCTLCSQWDGGMCHLSGCSCSTMVWILYFPFQDCLCVCSHLCITGIVKASFSEPKCDQMLANVTLFEAVLRSLCLHSVMWFSVHFCGL